MQQSSSVALCVSVTGDSGEPSKDTSAADLFTERTEFDISKKRPDILLYCNIASLKWKVEWKQQQRRQRRV